MSNIETKDTVFEKGGEDVANTDIFARPSIGAENAPAPDEDKVPSAAAPAIERAPEPAEEQDRLGKLEQQNQALLDKVSEWEKNASAEQQREQYASRMTSALRNEEAILQGRGQQVQQLREKYKQAREEGDTDLEADIQIEIAAATNQYVNASNQIQAIKEQMQNIRSGAITLPSSPQTQDMTEQWLANNSWYGTPGNEQRTAAAAEAEKVAKSQGMEPGSQASFNFIDQQLSTMSTPVPPAPPVQGGEPAPSPDAGGTMHISADRIDSFMRISGDEFRRTNGRPMNREDAVKMLVQVGNRDSNSSDNSREFQFNA